MRPTQLPEIRQQMLEYLASPIGQRVWHHVSLTNGFFGQKANEKTSIHVLRQEFARWKNGDLYFVTAEMTALAQDAAKSMPKFSLRRSDLPSESGVIYFDSQLGNTKNVETGAKAPIVAVAWGPVGMNSQAVPGATIQERPYVWLSFYSDIPSELRAEAQIPTGPLMYDDEAALAFEDIDDIADVLGADNQFGWALTVTAAWLLMHQQVASVEHVELDRTTRRRLRREGIDDLQPIRVVSLRTHSPASGGDGSRDYHHRWVVKGHWRNQWYPSQKRHVPLWISPHVKGPDGAPLLGGEKVYAWTR